MLKEKKKYKLFYKKKVKIKYIFIYYEKLFL